MSWARLPDDIWLVDLDSNHITPPTRGDDIPPLPEPEGSQLRNHLKQVNNLISFCTRKQKMLCY